MPNKSTTRSKNYAPKYKWIGHIAVYFNDDERDAVLDYIGQREWDIEDSICTLSQAGYGVKFTYDESRDSYYLSLQSKDKSCPYYGYTIGTSHMEISRVIQIACYIVTELIPAEALDKPDEKQSPSW